MRIIAVAACAAALTLGSPARADEPALTIDADRSDRAPTQLDRLIERELDRLAERLQGVLDDLPRYALPEITEDGDIIIRRLPPRRPQGWPRDPDEMLDL